MANVYLDDSILQAIANAIRTQTESTATFLPSEMPAAINMIGDPSATLELGIDNNDQLRFWPGWDDASWEDIKFIMDEYNMGRRRLPNDICPGSYKFWPISDGKILFKLISIINGTLVFECTSPNVSDFFSLDKQLDNLYEISEYKDCLTDDKMFVLTKDKFNIEVEHVSWTSTPVVCVTPDGDFIEAEKDSEFYYVPMFSIGNKLGKEYTGKDISIEEVGETQTVAANNEIIQLDGS